jgi:aspartate/methionine/tyrosine aminotransferase
VVCVYDACISLSLSLSLYAFGDVVHRSPNGADGVINIFSLSKSYGLAGWRVGYIAYPPSLHEVSECTYTCI